MTGMTKIAVTYPSDAPNAPLHPLYMRYPGQTNPQPARLMLDCRTGELSAGWSAETGNAVLENEWCGRTRTYAVPAALPVAKIRELLATAAPLAVRVLAGYSETESDGWSAARGHLDEDGTRAEGEIVRLCEEETYFDGGVWEAGDYLCDTRSELGLTAATTDDELRALETRLDAEARAEGITLWDTYEALEGWRDELRPDAEEA